MIDTPGWGGSFVRGSAPSKPSRSRWPALAEENVVRNEFLEERLETALNKISYMTKADGDAYMIREGLTFDKVTRDTTAKYLTLFDHGNWPAASTPADTKAPPNSFGNTAVASGDVPAHFTNAQVLVLALIHQANHTAFSRSERLAGCLRV